MIFKIFGFLIDSDTDLPGLEPYHKDGARTPSIQLRRTSYISLEDESSWQLRRLVRADPRGKYWSLHKGESQYVLEYDKLVQFVISTNGEQVLYSVSRSDLTPFFCYALLHLVLPFLLHLKSVPVYHAAAVSFQSESLIFFGHSGQGKSTLAAAFAQTGYPVITDDILVIEEQKDRFWAVPGLPWVRLCPDSVEALFAEDMLPSEGQDADGKHRVDTKMGLLPFTTEAKPVHAVYILSEPEPISKNGAVEIAQVPSAEALGLLLSRDSVLAILDRDQVACVLDSLSRLVKTVPVYRLTLDQGLHHLPQVISNIVGHAERTGSLATLAAGPES